MIAGRAGSVGASRSRSRSPQSVPSRMSSRSTSPATARDQRGSPRRSSRPCRRPRSRAGPRAGPRSLRATTGWSSTIAMRIGRAGSAPSPRPPLQRDVGPAARPALDVEDRPDLLRPLLHVQEPEAARPLGVAGGVGGDPGPGVVDRQRVAAPSVDAVADDDRRLAVLDRVRQRLLGDPEDRQLDVGRRRACRRRARAGPRRRPAARSGGPASRAPARRRGRRGSAAGGRRRSPAAGRRRCAPISAPSVSPAASSRRTSSVSSWSASSWMSAASRARSASVAATTRSRWSWRPGREAGERPDGEPAGDARSRRARRGTATGPTAR